MKKMGVIVLAAAFVLSGCSLFGGTSSSDKRLDLSIGSEEMTLRIFVNRPNDVINEDLIKKLEEAGAAFQTRYPNITVEVDDSTVGNLYESRLLEMTENDQSPDIVVISSELIPSMVENQVLADLTLFADMDQIAMDDFYVPAIEQLSGAGRWLGVPISVVPMMVFYYKDWFDNANLPYPEGEWTWEQYYDIALALQAANSKTNPNGYGGIIPNDLFGMELLILSKGGSVLSPDGMQASGYLDSPESASAVQYMVDLYRDQNMHEEWMNPTDYGNAWMGSFYRRDTGMAVSSSLEMFFFDLFGANEQVGYAPIPGFRDGTHVNAGSVIGLSIPERSKHLAEAWAFLKMFAIEPNEISKQFYQYLPAPSKTIAEASGQTTDPYMSAVLNEMHAFRTYSWNVNSYFDEAVRESNVNTLINEMFKEGVDVQTQLTKIAERLDAALAEARAAAVNDLNS